MQTRVLYRPGRADAAHTVAESMPLRAEVALAPAGSTGADVHVLIGHDARYSAGCAAIAACATPDRLALSLSWQARAAAGEVELRR
ncbi:MAG TPA: LytR C-terminal domain-containing protein [Rubrivivax sp.]|nr:LytR C-terminal domain-containing protein [Rubrivivax sp.]